MAADRWRWHDRVSAAACAAIANCADAAEYKEESTRKSTPCIAFVPRAGILAHRDSPQRHADPARFDIDTRSLGAAAATARCFKPRDCSHRLRRAFANRARRTAAMNSCCAFCGAAGPRQWLRKGQWQYLHCPACSAVWLDPLPDDAWAESYYDGPYFEGGGRGGYRDYLADEAQHVANARARVALARRCGAVPPGLWIDVGCAAGYTLVEARNAGFEVRGVDVSPWARAVASERFGLDVAASISHLQQECPGQASVMTMFQVLEHLPAPLAALKQARACLRPGGLLVVETWDRASLAARMFGKRWQQITPPSVAWLFDRQSLGYAMTQAGFELNTIVPTSKAVSIGWVCGLLAEKAPRLLAPALSWTAGSSLGKLKVNYRLGDLVTVVAAAGGSAVASDQRSDAQQQRHESPAKEA